jgi:hypothetical protein
MTNSTHGTDHDTLFDELRKIEWRATTPRLEVDDESAKRPDEDVEEEAAAGSGGVSPSPWWPPSDRVAVDPAVRRQRRKR